MLNLGLIIFASLFIISGINHIKNHSAMAGYTSSVLHVFPKLGVLGGWPTGVLLLILGLGSVVTKDAIYFYGITGFLLLATLLFHRNFLKDPGALAFAQLVK